MFNKSKLLYFPLLLILLAFLFSCEKKFDEYYKVPENLIGTILEVLKDDGNYTQFTKSVELVGFDDVLGKTGNFTVFAPDDNAFKEFLTNNGYDSITQIPNDKLKEIVMYHIIFWSYSKFKLQYGLGVEDNNVEYDPENFRKQTRFQPPLTEETDSSGKKYTVYHENKFIPVYFSEYFSDLHLEGNTDYSFFYPETVFTGSNVDRAAIVEWDVPAQNGWIHKINKVLVPPLNHDEILSSKEEYSTFKSLIDKRVTFEYNAEITRDQPINQNTIVDSIFIKRNKLFSTGISPNAEDMDNKGQSRLMTVFAPTNTALQNFLTEHTKGYKSINEIGSFFMDWYLLHYFGSNYWPSQLSALTDKWELPLTKNLADGNISFEDISYSQMASNGPFYGLNKYLLPKVFETVVQPIFGDKNYEWFCELLIFYQVDLLLNNENINFTVFAPSNQAMTLAGYTARTGLGGFGLYSAQNPLAPVPRKRATDIIKSHIVFGEIQKENLTAGTFLKTVENSYLGVTENGIFGGGDNVATTMGEPNSSGQNGILIPVNRLLISPFRNILQIITDQVNHPEFEEFLKLLQASDLLIYDEKYNPVGLVNLATGVNYSCFIPSNESIIKAKLDGIIPTDPSELGKFLRYHFVEGIIFSDGIASGTKKTTRHQTGSTGEFENIEILNSINNLRLRDGADNLRTVEIANIMATNGVVHSIDSCLIFK